MKENNLKNMIVLKELPSNIIEEAIVILKSGTKIRNLEKIEKNKVIERNSNENRDKEYIIKEAEMLVNQYMADMENTKENKVIFKNKINKKYKNLKKYAYISTFIIFIQALMILIK